MDVYIIAIAYYATLLIGVSGLVLITTYLLDKLYTALLNHFRIYNEFVRFVYDRKRKKREVVKPNINSKEAEK